MKHFVTADGQYHVAIDGDLDDPSAVEVPERPSEAHVWQDDTWSLVQTQEDPLDYPLLRWQFQAMIDILGKRTAIEQAISALPSETDKAVARAKLNHTDVFQRTDPLVVSLSALVGMSSDELDSAWLQAKDLT